jgi:hypothetical protein
MTRFDVVAGRRAVLCLALGACTPGCPNSAEVVADSKPAEIAAPAVDIAESIYEGGLKGSWQSLGTAPKEMVAGSPAKIRLDEGTEWILARPGLAGDFGGVTFRMRVAPGDGEFIEVGLRAGAASAAPPPRSGFVKVSPAHRVSLGDYWVEVTIPIEELDPDRRPFDRVVLRAFSAAGADWLQIDHVGLVRAGSVARLATGGLADGAAPTVTRAPSIPTPMRVACDGLATKISPLIYGVGGFSAENIPADVGAVVFRWGGNGSSRYNWEGHFDSGAADWFFENRPATAWTQFLSANSGRGKATAFTVPIGGWVAKDGTSYSFPVSVFGPQGRTDPSHPDVGDGTKAGSGKLAPGPPERTSAPAPPEWAKRWVQAIRAADVGAGGRSVKEYILDNEPMLWSATHRDVHPDPLGYDELLDRTIRYGTAIREADPDATIAGPAEWGWSGYLYSAKDLAPGAFAKPDRRAHDGVALVEWYLRKLREHEQKTKVRVLDVLDLHYYPQEAGVYSDAADPRTAQLRLRSTRSLWDPTYVDESWINDSVHLLPRMKEWVDKNYPGRGISLGEWNFGGEKHITGALATAEALGRFAQFGVASAFYWTAPGQGSASAQGFLAYRNFNGKGGHFQDWYLPTTSPAGVSLFASRDEEGKHLVLIIVNMVPDVTRLAQIDVGSCGANESRTALVYDGSSPGFVPEAAPQGSAASIDQTLPPWSITVVDIRLAQPLPKAVAH